MISLQWQDIKEQIKRAYSEIETAYKNYMQPAVDKTKQKPILNNAIKIALNIIPVIGPNLKDLYDNMGKSEEKKTQEILEFLSKLEQQTEEQFTKIAKDLQSNEKIIIEEIIQSGTRLSELISKSSDEIRINLIHISDGLLEIMNRTRSDSKERDIPYTTPNLLLLLLQIHNSIAMRCMNKIYKNLGENIRNRLKIYVVNEQPRLEKEAGNKYVPFDWLERKDVRIAQQEAFNEGYPVVTEKHLLLGILQSESKTSKEIRNKLGDKFEHLLDIIRKEPPFEPPSTLGISLDSI